MSERLHAVSLTRDQWLDVLAGLDSRLYEDAPDQYRSSGGVLDPRIEGTSWYVADPDTLDDEEREEHDNVIAALDAHDAIEAAIHAALGPEAP